MSLLTLIQDAAKDPGVGVAAPSSVIGNTTDLNAVAFLALAQKEGEEISRRHDWQNLVVQHTQASLAAEAQTAFPSDFDRLVYNAELWNRTSNLKYLGPTPPREWQRLKQGISGGVTGWWRLLGNQLNIYPAPTAGITLATEYVSKNFCQSSGGTGQSAWAADTDTGKIPERLMRLGIIWRWRHSKGLDYAEDMATYERELERSAGRDRGTGLIRKGSPVGNNPPPPFWPGTISV